LTTLFIRQWYSMITEIIVALLSLIFLLNLFLMYGSNKKNISNNKDLMAVKPDKRIPCPLCGNKLNPGEKLHSELVRKKGEKTTGTLYIYGCPHCYPRSLPEKKSAPKKCPVCHRKMEKNDYATGYYRELPEGRKRAHVTGCVKCRTGRTSNRQ